MKQLPFVLTLALVLCSCPDYDFLPEPELPVEHLEFGSAVYSAADKTISLDFSGAFKRIYLDNIYSYYNKQHGFVMGLYLAGGDTIGIKEAGIREDRADDNTVTFRGLRIYLTDTAPSPVGKELVFKTKEPMYFSGYSTSSWGSSYPDIGLKAFIKTPRLPVTALP